MERRFSGRVACGGCAKRIKVDPGSIKQDRNLQGGGGGGNLPEEKDAPNPINQKITLEGKGKRGVQKAKKRKTVIVLGVHVYRETMVKSTVYKRGLNKKKKKKAKTSGDKVCNSLRKQNGREFESTRKKDLVGKGKKGQKMKGHQPGCNVLQ